MPDYSRKLNSDQVQKIRRRYWVDGVKQSDIARQFNVSPSQVSQIIRRRSWIFLPSVPNEYN